MRPRNVSLPDACAGEQVGDRVNSRVWRMREALRVRGDVLGSYCGLRPMNSKGLAPNEFQRRIFRPGTQTRSSMRIGLTSRLNLESAPRTVAKDAR